MRNIYIFVLFIAYFAYKYLPPTEEKNNLVLIETKGLYHDELSNIKGTVYITVPLGDWLEKKMCQLVV